MKKEYQKLSRKALVCMYIASGILDVICAVVTLVVWRVAFPDEKIAMIISVIILALCLFELLINPYIRYQRYRYAIDDECIDVKEGLIVIKRNIVPIGRLHKIAISRGPIDRMLGLGKVLVTTAGGDVTIRFLEMEVAEKIADTLKSRINDYAADEKGAR